MHSAWCTGVRCSGARCSGARCTGAPYDKAGCTGAPAHHPRPPPGCATGGSGLRAPPLGKPCAAAGKFGASRRWSKRRARAGCVSGSGRAPPAGIPLGKERSKRCFQHGAVVSRRRNAPLVSGISTFWSRNPHPNLHFSPLTFFRSFEISIPRCIFSPRNRIAPILRQFCCLKQSRKRRQVQCF